MAGNRCPHCGSSIQIRGNRWECGWCGDFGSLASLKTPSRNKPTPASVPGLGELEKGVWKILNGIKVYSPENYKEPAFRLALYAMSHGLLNAGSSGGYGLSLVHTFLGNYPVFSYGDFQKAVSGGTPVFGDEFSLSREELGTFWQNLLPRLPTFEAADAWPDWLTDIFVGWSEVESLFLGCSEDMIYPTMTELFNAHWRQYSMPHFHTGESGVAIHHQDFSVNECACRNLLFASFPEAATFFPPERLEDVGVAEILEEMAGFQPKTALQMMKLLLDTEQPHLQEPETAHTLLGNMLCDLCTNSDFLPVLLYQLERDDVLARQLFQSAYVDFPQECILEVCEDLGRLRLARHLKELLAENPFFQGF